MERLAAAGGEAQDILDAIAQTSALFEQEATVLPYLFGVLCQAVAEIAGQHTNCGDWGSKLVRKTGHKVSLLFGELFGSAGVVDQKNDGRQQDEGDRKASGEVAHA